MSSVADFEEHWAVHYLLSLEGEAALRELVFSPWTM